MVYLNIYQRDIGVRKWYLEGYFHFHWLEMQQVGEVHTEPAYTEYRTVRHKLPRLKVIVNDINEIWLIDLAYVDKLAKYNKDIK